MALLPKLKTKDKAKSVSFFGKATNQNCALLPAPSFLHSASPLFTLALAQIICKNLSYFPRIVERVYLRGMYVCIVPYNMYVCLSLKRIHNI